ncbi:unnamed protein product, partial [Meganyctiphanes norvegica]
MNGEPTSTNPQVPVTTLAGISSLSELLPVLPLPGTTSDAVGGSQSLLFHPRVAEEAQRLLNSQDTNLIAQLANTLAATSTQYIELKEGLSEAVPSSFFKSAPPLLKGILEVHPNLFADNQGSGSNVKVAEEVFKGIKSEKLKGESKSRVPHINNVSVIQCGPALAQAAHTQKVKKEASEESKNQTQFSTQNHIETVDCKRVEDFTDHHVNKTMKEPVVSLKRLSAGVKERVNEGANSTPSKRNPDKKGDLKSMGRIPKLSSNSVSSNAKNSHTPRRGGANRGSRRDGKNDKFEEKQNEESESEEEEKKKTKFFKGREKDRDDQKKKDKADRKRNRAASDEDDFSPEVETKRRRKAPVTRDSSADEDEGEDEEEEEEDDDDYDDYDDDDYDSGGEGGGKKKGGRERKSGKPEPMIKRAVVIKKAEYNKKRFERKLVPVNEKLSPEEMMETGVYQRFNRTVEKIFDNTEDLDLNAEIEEGDDVPQEYLIPKYELAELCSEAAKLKSIGAMSIVPPERLVRLLNILEKNIRDGCRVTPIVDEEDEEEDKLWVELVMERIMRAMDASLTSFYIMTALNMSKRIYLEDVIERCVQFAKFQLSNTIYPTFDPVYSVTGRGDYLTTSKAKRNKHKGGSASRNLLSLYNKIHEMVGMLADLLDIQTLTDTTVLQLSTMGVAPFFVENVAELQLSALRLVTKVFAKYNKHRRLLLDDIMASIARLPNSKRSLRTYRLNSDENIQMLTALVLQLIQCVVELPDDLNRNKGDKSKSGDEVSSNSHNSKDSKEAVASEVHKVDRDVLVCQRYEAAIQTAYSFLSVFLQKTGNKSEEIDYRPLFENFVQDLLVTVNKPEWPASELLLSLLGKLLVQKFSNKNTDMALRVSSLDCLGLVAAKLRHDAVSSELKISTIDAIIKEVKEEESQNGPCIIEDVEPQENGTSEVSSKKSKKKKSNSSIPKDPDEAGDEEEERTVFLQRVLLDWLAVNSANETPLLHARHFYITQWYRDSYSEILRTKHTPNSPNNKKAASHNKKKRKRRGEESEESSEESEEETEEKKDELDEDTKVEVTRLSERRKKFLLTKAPAFPPASSGVKVQTLQTHIDYENAELITRYLARKRPFSQSFDLYLKQILRVLTESAIAVRTKAMKCLTMVVEGDPNVLNRKDMQMGVHHSFLDHSTSVREAAVDLIGKFVLSRPEVLNNYYEMISARILDTGVSVRKRVIKIMKDICLECPEFPKIPEICVKMIRRVNDEEGIKKLVMEVFVNMWFTPVRERPNLDKEALLRKVNNITEVVVTCKETGLDWFEQLLHSMFRPKEDKDDVTKVNTEPPKTLITACKQIVDCLVKHILVIEENAEDEVVEIKSEDGQDVKPNKTPQSVSQRLLACLKTLHLFAKIRPHLMVEHCITLQPYLAIKCQTQGDYTMIGVVARTLELVVPLMEHPSETFLSQLEEDAVKLILQHDRTVITSCLALLGSIVNTVTHNYKLIRDCFNKYYNFILDYKKLHQEFSGNPKLESYKPFFRRALYTVGLLLRHFDMKREDVRCGLPEDIVIDVFATLLYFMDLTDINLQYCTLQSLGSVCIRYYELMMGPDLKDLYNTLLVDQGTNTQLRIQTLQNVETYLQEEEIRMIKEDQECDYSGHKCNLRVRCTSRLICNLIRKYIRQVMDCVVAGNMVVRHSALRVIQLVLAQGLVHPVQIVPYLVCMSTDTEEPIAHSADKQLQDIEKKYPGFISMKAMQGFRLSYKLHTLIQKEKPTRGFRVKEGEHPGALNGFLYSLMRTTKQHRRAVAISLLKQFDDQARTNLKELLFIADNLAYYPYQVFDEPLFIIHHIDIMISCTGTNLLQSFRENLIPPPGVEMRTNPDTGELEYNLDDDDDDDVETLLARIPENEEQIETLFDCINSAQGCLLLLVLKDYLKEIYGLTDGRITQYSPSDSTKQYEKGASKKNISRFNPKITIKRLKDEAVRESEPKEGNEEEDDPKKKLTLINEYLDFKALMLKIDPDDEDEDSDGGFPKTRSGNEPNNKDSRNNQQDGEHVLLLPGTKDGWKGHPKEEEIEVVAEQLPPMQTRHTRGSGQQQQQSEAPTENRSPIKPITIRASQIKTPPREKRSHRHRDKDKDKDHSHRSSSHKKHKKKKKRKKNSDSENDSECRDS